ncbi:ABC transporter substrate-binding protein [Novosphingobium flavum]|uniref:ABC transporter substrate-binding protein n=1 Tax=Novosphingobium flavum TaxID=1778672 RepID=A0A7X1FQW0_9SPHN|nr:ABC transporter substrate-binding protein [Novosphingobium flavum]MBC2665296.1 ABC transporter substrate-binding protein [Novosphingobium flavum]
MGADIRVVDAGGTHERVTIELMRRLRLFERVGLSVERTLVTNGGEAVDLLLGGKADAALQVGFGPALAAIADGAPLRVVAGANLLTVHAIYARDPAIRSLADLAGRRVGVGALGALTHQLAVAALRKQGLDPGAVEFVTIGNSAAIFRHLLEDRIDAGFGESEVFHDQARYGVHALADAVLWRELPDFPNQASFATLAALGERREALVRVLAAHALLYRALHHGPAEDYLAAWAAALPEFPAAEGAVQLAFYRENRPFAEDLRLPEPSVAMLQRLNLAMGRQQAVLPFAALADMSLAAEACALADHIEQTCENRT